MQNHEDPTEKQVQEEYEDSLFRLVMHKAAEQEGKLYLEELEVLRGNPEYAPSSKSEKSFLKLLDHQLKKQKSIGTKQRHHIFLKRAGLLFAAILVTISILMFTVSAFRVRVYNLVLGITDKYTSLQLQDTDTSSNENQTVNWKNAYMPTYIPDGYVADGLIYSDTSKSITLKNKEDDSLNIVYTEYGSSSDIRLDTENASVAKTITINGNQGMLVIKGGMVTVVWTMNNDMFTVFGKVSEELILQIAESVQFVE